MTTNAPLPFASASLQLASTPKFSSVYYAQIHSSYAISRIRMCRISALPQTKTPPKRTTTRKRIPSNPSSEAEELVRSIVRNISDKQPLLTTLNKYVQFVRTEHCFLLFEELGRSDKWLQCLEVFNCASCSCLAACFYCYSIDIDSNLSEFVCGILCIIWGLFISC